MIGRLRPPDRASAAALGAATAAWLGAAAGPLVGIRWLLAGGAPAAVALALGPRRLRRVAGALVLVVAGGLSGASAAAHTEDIVNGGGPQGPVTVVAAAVTDSQPGPFGEWMLVQPLDPGNRRPAGMPALARGDLPSTVSVGDVVVLRGSATSEGGIARGAPYGWRLAVRSLETVDGPSPVLDIARAVRARVGGALAPFDDRPGAALVAGFLIGDERRLSDLDRSAMRAAGLSHFTAVSGSNVALFLAGLWVLAGPLGIGSRRRAVVGLAGLVVFAAITRWEPSVLRACWMAAILLVTRALGFVVPAWGALGAAVTGLLLLDGSLAYDAGFQLSVAATAGVIAGADLGRGDRGNPVRRAAGAAVSAHLAVMPVLLLRFGDIPWWGPLLNVIASPLVAISTVTGGLGLALPWQFVMQVAVGAADAVLDVARWGARLPDSGFAAVSIGALVMLSVRRPWLRVPVAAVAAVVLVGGLAPRPTLAPDTVAFLAVGQGDAALLVTEQGATILVDGGPDPVLLEEKLTARGIDQIDLLVVSHSHRDHIAGLEAVVGRRPVTTLWHSDPPDSGGGLRELLEAADAAGITIGRPRPGTVVDVGGATVEVLGPVRRYASANDQSLVLRITIGGRRVLFTGDVERYAQADLPSPAADVLKVPHQGAATSDPDWLVGVGADVAVVSVGPNDYGHPDPDLLAGLTAAGMQVLRTDRHGDLVLPPAEPDMSPPTGTIEPGRGRASPTRAITREGIT